MLRKQQILGWLTLALIAWPWALWGADKEIQEPKTPIARLEVQPARVDWLPQVDYESLVLTVTGPENLYVEKRFGAGETPSFSSLDLRDGRLPDGVYAYELRTVPRLAPELHEKLAKAREGDDSAVNEFRLEGGLLEEPLVQSGHLWLQGGSFVDKIPIQPGTSRQSKPEKKPPLSSLAAMDQVIPDDLVVQGHACIGSVCTSVVSGDPTLKLREGFGGLFQIKFEPDFCCHPTANDWYIGANSPTEASGDFFIRSFDTVPFRIGPAAPANALTISNGNGNIGLGTLTPGAKLHVFGSATDDAFASAGPNPLSGPAFNFGYGGTSFGRGAGFLNVRPDASATAPNPSLRFLTANVQRMIITNTGNVGIGTTNPGAKLEVSGGEVRFPPGAGAAGFTHFNLASDGKNYIRGTTIIADNSGNVGIGTSSPGAKLDVANGETRLDSNHATLNTHFNFSGTGHNYLRGTTIVADDTASSNVGIGCDFPTSKLVIGGTASNCSTAPFSSINPGSSTFTTSSSRTIKEHLEPVRVPSILEKISAIDVYKYDFIGGPKDKLGLMAEDFHEIFARGSDKVIDGQEVEMALWLAVQELTAQNKELRTQNEEIGKRLVELEARLTAGPGDTPK